MKFNYQREDLLLPLLQIIGAVEKRQTLPVLANFLLSAKEGLLTITATDTEIELQSKIPINSNVDGSVTVPARKLLDICKALPDLAMIDFTIEDNKIRIKSGRSKFVLSTLPASEFPLSNDIGEGMTIDLPKKLLNEVIKQTSFSMAQQDVRFYLNGMLLEISTNALRAIATDGHRLSYSTCDIESTIEEVVRVIIPRKSVHELGRLINTDAADEERVKLTFTPNHLKVSLGEVTLTTKLIDGRFPDYNRVIPLDCDKELRLEKSLLIKALSRAAILSNEKYHGIRLKFEANTLTLSTNNPDQEEANDELEIEYNGDVVDIGFNVSYLLDSLNHIETEKVRLLFKDGNSSCLIMPTDSEETKYVVMPMRL